MAAPSKSMADLNSAGPSGISADMIVATEGTCGGRPRIAGTRIRVLDIYVWHELRGQSVDEIVTSFPQLTHAQVHSALAYYFSHAEAIRAELASDEQSVEHMKLQLGLGPLKSKLAIVHGEEHSLSSR